MFSRIAATVILVYDKCCRGVVPVYPEAGNAHQREFYRRIAATVDPVVRPGKDICVNAVRHVSTIRIKRNHVAFELVESTAIRQIGLDTVIAEIVAIPGHGGNENPHLSATGNDGASSDLDPRFTFKVFIRTTDIIKASRWHLRPCRNCKHCKEQEGC
ncbi:MAG: hypothetical protein OXF73_04575 [Gammaproteobacteria bacterium]|nr:hypothetical protein [Gammaproteobacteria bacterium]